MSRQKPVWGPVIELVDLRYRPEVNTIEALAESDPSEQRPPRRTHMDHNARGVRPRSVIELVESEVEAYFIK